MFGGTDLIKLPVGAENEGQDMKHFDPDHSPVFVPFKRQKTKKINEMRLEL